MKNNVCNKSGTSGTSKGYHFYATLCLSCLSRYMREICSNPLWFCSLCPFWFCTGNTFAIFRTRRGKDSIPYSQHAPIFTKSFYRFFHSLSLLSSPHTTCQPLSAIRRIQDVIVRQEYVTREDARKDKLRIRVPEGTEVFGPIEGKGAEKYSWIFGWIYHDTIYNFSVHPLLAYKHDCWQIFTAWN